MKHVIINVQDDYQVQIVAATTFLMTFGAHMSIFFIIEVKVIMLIRWLYMSPTKYVDQGV